MCVIKQRYGFKTLEKEMAPYSSILAWKIPWTEEPGRVHEATKVSDMTEYLQLAFAA